MILNMAKVFTFGCSMTIGAALDDVWDTEQKIQIEAHSKYAWPQALADLMNIECVNLSRGGASNKEIYHTILTTPNITPDDIVIVQWTYPQRWCIIPDDQTEIDQIGPWQNTDSSVAYYTHIHTDTDSMYESEFRKEHIKLHFKNLGIRLYHLKLRKAFYLNTGKPSNGNGDNCKIVYNSSIEYLDSYLLDIAEDMKSFANDANHMRIGHPGQKAHFQQAWNIRKEITK
jgi:hypothetical protein